MENNKLTNMVGKRINYIDNIKGLLIFLVVFGHFLYDFSIHNVICNDLAKIIYLFHMPVFVFISGFLFKDKVNYTKIKQLIVFYLIGNTFFLLFSYMFYGKEPNLIEPYYSFWYLLALITWRIGSKYLKNIKWILPISLAVSLLVGFSTKINNSFALSRIICFFPFFILGTKVKEKNLCEYILKNKKLFTIISLLLLIEVSFLIISIIPTISFNDLQMFPYINKNGIVYRLIIYVIACIMILIFVSLMPNKKNILTKLGRNSLYIYLYHRIFSLIITKYWMFDNNTILIFLLSIISSIIICAIFGSGKIRNFTENVYEMIIYLPRDNDYKYFKYFFKWSIVILIIVILSLPLYTYNNLETFSNYELSNSEDKIYNCLSSEEIKNIDNSFSILFTGDLILLQEQVKKGYDINSKTYNYDNMFEYTKKYIDKADLSIGVLEGPMASEEQGFSNSDFDDGIEIHLNYPDEFGNAIKSAGFDLVTMANNHVFDKGIEGAINTINKLEDIDLDYIGFNKKDEKKENYRIIEKDNLKIGILAYTYGANYWSEDELIEQDYVPIIVDEKSKYFEQVKKSVQKDFEELKEENPNVIVVLPHYGTQFSHSVDEFQELWNNIFLDLGANIILGDHSHSVQPIEIKENCNKEDAIIINCPGNYANSYTEHDGDATAMIEIYIDKNDGKFISSSVIPMYVCGKQDRNYIPIPIYDIINNKEISKEITTYEMKRVKEVSSIIANVMLGENLNIDNIREYNYYTKEGYKRDIVNGIDINKKSEICMLIEESNSICFIGDSITEGTKNGGYGWYEPLINSYKNKEVFNISKGGATSKTIIDLIKEGNIYSELYIIAIGTNDIRYRNESICAMDENEYTNNLNEIIEEIENINNSKFVFIAPWNSLEHDELSLVKSEEKQELMNRYSSQLRVFCKENGYLFINPNSLIFDRLRKEPYNYYMIDYIHPNSSNGIKLYSYAVLEASIVIDN